MLAFGGMRSCHRPRGHRRPARSVISFRCERQRGAANWAFLANFAASVPGWARRARLAAEFAAWSAKRWFSPCQHG